LNQRPAPGQHCRAWPSPDGAVVFASDDGPGRSFGPAPRLAVLNGFGLNRTQLTHVRADAVVGPGTWSPDAVFAAFCVHGRQLMTMVSPWRSAAITHHRCHPSYTIASTQLSTDGSAIYEGGARLPLDRLLDLAVGGPINGHRVMALVATRPGLVAA